MVLAQIPVEWFFKYRLINWSSCIRKQSLIHSEEGQNTPLLVVTEFLAQSLPHRSSQIFTECMPG